MQSGETELEALAQAAETEESYAARYKGSQNYIDHITNLTTEKYKNPFMPEVHLNNTYKFTCNLTEHTVSLRYKDQQVNLLEH
jgi:hypothetical protein